MKNKIISIVVGLVLIVTIVPMLPNVKATNLLSESFNTWLPAGWSETVYSGDGHWQQSSDSSEGRAPSGGAAPWAIADSDNDSHSTELFDVGLFTPNVNLTGVETPVYLDCGYSFRQAGSDLGKIRVWSTGGTVLEQTLETITVEGSGNIHDQLDVANYSSTDDIQIEFYYSTQTATYRWFFGVDNVKIENAFGNEPPSFGTPSPVNGSISQPLSLLWSIPISDPNGDAFSWTIQCNDSENSGAISDTNGTKSLALSGLVYSTVYTIWVNATDGFLWTQNWYTFRTSPSLNYNLIYDNGGPSPGLANPSIISNGGTMSGIWYNAQIADDFTLTETKNITKITWWGTYQGGSSSGVNTYNIYIYDTSDSEPTGAGTDHPESTALANYTVLATGEYVEGSYIYGAYKYSALLLPAFTAVGGHTYWISIQWYTDPFTWNMWEWYFSNSTDIFTPEIPPIGYESVVGATAEEPGLIEEYPFWKLSSAQGEWACDRAFMLYETSEGGGDLIGAPTKNLNITLNPSGTANIIVNPIFWNPSASIGGNTATAPDAFTLENNGTIQVDVTVNASDTSAWTLGSSPAHNQFQMQWGTGTAPTGPSLKITGTDSSSTGVIHPRVATFNSTYFIEAWENYTSTYNAWIRIGERTSGLVSWVTSATSVEGSMSAVSGISVTTLDSTHFAVAWHSQNGYTVARVGHFSGSSIIWDTSTTNAYTNMNQPSIAAFNSTYFVISMVATGGSISRSIIGHFTGSSITFGTQIMTNVGKMPYVATLDTTRFVLTGIKQAGPYAVSILVGHRTGTAITIDTTITGYIPITTGLSPQAVTKINSTYFLLSYANNTHGWLNIGHFNGTAVVWTMGPTAYCNWSGTGLLSDICYMGNSNFTVVYSDISNASNNGTKMGKIGASSLSFITNTTPLKTSGNQPPSLAAFDSTNLINFLANTPATFLTSFDSGGSGSASWTNIDSTPASFVSDFAWDQSQPFGLQLFMPTSSSTAANQTATITFIATMD